MGATEEKIARFIVETDPASIPQEALKSANLGIFDCIGTILAGVASPPGKIMARFIKEAGGKPETTVVGMGLRTTPVLGALANGAMAHALDYDDLGAMGHPSVVLLPAIISLAERVGASGKDILQAYAIGYEVGEAISSACHYAQMERGFHATPMFGTMAATAASARLLKLSVKQTIMAMGIAGSMPSGIAQNLGSYTKGLHAGLASHSGVMACLLAQDGWTGTDIVFESKVGYLHAYVGKDMYDLEKIRNSLGKWHVINGITIKKYPCCGSNHNTLDSVLSLLRENDIKFEDIERVDVDHMPYISHILLYPEPIDGFQGKFSIHYNVATAIIDKRIDIDSFGDDKLKRPQYREALNKVKIHIVSPWDPHFRGYAAENPVTITLKDGRHFHKTTNRYTMHGSPSDPLTENEVLGKFKSNAALTLPANAVDRACSLWRNLQPVAKISEALKAVAG